MINKKIMVTGGTGSIGYELVKQLSLENEVIIIDQNKIDISKIKNVVLEVCNIKDYSRLDELFKKHKPDMVFHAAAYKYVTYHEKDFYTEIVDTNINGTVNLIKCVNKYNVKKFVFISTDKAVNPTSLMGASKLIGEIIVRRNGGIVVRFGNVMRSVGSVIPIWEEQIKKGEPITVTDSRMERYFMSIDEACYLAITASEMGKDGETFILDMGKPIKIIDLANKIIKESGKDVKIKMIKPREGEKLTEDIMTESEKEQAIKKDKFWILK